MSKPLLTSPTQAARTGGNRDFYTGHEMVLIAKHDGKIMESELTSLLRKVATQQKGDFNRVKLVAII